MRAAPTPAGNRAIPAARAAKSIAKAAATTHPLPITSRWALSNLAGLPHPERTNVKNEKSFALSALSRVLLAPPASANALVKLSDLDTGLSAFSSLEVPWSKRHSSWTKSGSSKGTCFANRGATDLNSEVNPLLSKSVAIESIQAQAFLWSSSLSGPSDVLAPHLGCP